MMNIFEDQRDPSFVNRNSLPSTAEGRLQGEVNVFLGVESDDERGNIDNLLPNTDVPLPDKNARMVDTLGESKLEHLQTNTLYEEIGSVTSFKFYLMLQLKKSLSLIYYLLIFTSVRLSISN